MLLKGVSNCLRCQDFLAVRCPPAYLDAAEHLVHGVYPGALAVGMEQRVFRGIGYNRRDGRALVFLCLGRRALLGVLFRRALHLGFEPLDLRLELGCLPRGSLLRTRGLRLCSLGNDAVQHRLRRNAKGALEKCQRVRLRLARAALKVLLERLRTLQRLRVLLALLRERAPLRLELLVRAVDSGEALALLGCGELLGLRGGLGRWCSGRRRVGGDQDLCSGTRCGRYRSRSRGGSLRFRCHDGHVLAARLPAYDAGRLAESPAWQVLRGNGLHGAPAKRTLGPPWVGRVSWGAGREPLRAGAPRERLSRRSR